MVENPASNLSKILPYKSDCYSETRTYRAQVIGDWIREAHVMIESLVMIHADSL